MADYYTEFSFFIPLPADPVKQSKIKTAMDAWYEKRSKDDTPLGIDWNIEKEGSDTGIWCRHEDGGCGNVDDAAEFTQEALWQLGDPKAAVVIEWANTCSKPRLDAYSGGACVVTAGRIEVISPSALAEELIGKENLQRINTQ